MAENVLDLENNRNKTKILQGLQEETDRICSNEENTLVESAAPAPAAISDMHDENNNENENVETSPAFNQPIENFYAMVDLNVENILQSLTDDAFINYFNFDKVMVRCLLMELHQRTYYHPMNDKNLPISFDMSVLVTLYYLTNGHLDYIKHLGNLNSVSSIKIKNCIQGMCQTFSNFLTPVYVRFPCSAEEINYVKSHFFQQYSIPGVVGLLDCHYIRLQNVQRNRMHMYLKPRRVEPSIAVQMICDNTYRFLDINPRFSGSASKGHVWDRSHIKHIVHHIQQSDPYNWIIAGRGYPMSTEVINPFRTVLTEQQKLINTALIGVHHVVDNAFDLLKDRFRCLNGSLPFSHKHAANIVTSCATLHNYLLVKNGNVYDAAARVDKRYLRITPNWVEK